MTTTTPPPPPPHMSIRDRIRVWRDRSKLNKRWQHRIQQRQTTRTGIMSPNAASALASFVLVWVGTSVATLTNPSVPGGGNYGNMAIALAFGVALTVGLWIAGPNAQNNPAETVALSLRGHQDKQAIKLVLPQLGGAIAASFLVRMMFGEPGLDNAKLGATIPGTAALWTAVFLVELIGTYLLVRSSNSAWQHGISLYYTKAVISGATLCACVFAAVTISGGAFNPARFFGPVLVFILTGGSLFQALDSTHLTVFGFLLVYLLAQFAGAYLAVGRSTVVSQPASLNPNTSKI
jgi:glycerol uptake facilitator protein